MNSLVHKKWTLLSSILGKWALLSNIHIYHTFISIYKKKFSDREFVPFYIKKKGGEWSSKNENCLCWISTKTRFHGEIGAERSEKHSRRGWMKAWKGNLGEIGIGGMVMMTTMWCQLLMAGPEKCVERAIV